MTKPAIVSNNEEYLITPSLLNAWANIWNCIDYVKESEKDEISIEDKQSLATEKAFSEFLDTLNRIPSEPNIYMQKGIDFEEECYKGNTIVSPIIENGAYQIVGKKEIVVDGIKILLYGRLDVLKGGTIYDIKRVTRYSPQKYIKSFQHSVYMELFPDAKKFTYLVYDDNGRLHEETYYRDECVNVKGVVSDYIRWLKENDLYEMYISKWKAN